VTDDELVRELLGDPDANRWLTLVSSFIRDDPSHARRLGESLLARATDAERALGADLLGQVATGDSEQAPLIADVVLKALAGHPPVDVAASLVTALGHTFDPRAKPAVLEYVNHPDADVRYSAAVTLPALGFDDDVLTALCRLSADENEDVRDWATFGLAQSKSTDPRVIEALLARADDPDDDTRAEAIFGLAQAHHASARSLIDHEMEGETHGSLIEEALKELNRADRIG
jgi:HEAT repeat protein